MAKGNLILGMGRGKLGDVVLSRAYGQQISRARARVIKNPKTKGQQVQRIILATVTKAYSQMKAIVNHSFQGVSYGAASMNRFNQLNMDFLRNQLGANGLDNDAESPLKWAWFTTQMNQLAVPNRWAISRGTLTTVDFAADYNDPEKCIGIVFPQTTVPANGILSYDAFSQQLGIEIGDQLTFCAIDGTGKFHYGRFICSPSDGDTTKSVSDTSVWNERTINVDVEFDENKVVVNLISLRDSGLYAAAFGVILSRKQGTNWQRSNSDMVIWNMDFAGIGASMNQALYEVETGALDFASPYYLNNANQQTATAEGGDGGGNP